MMGTAEPHATLSVALRDYPGFNRFALDLLNGKREAVELSSRRDPLSMTESGRTRDAAMVAELDRTNRAWGNDVRAELASWAGGESLTIIAGQQVGFAGGPLYTLAKIASMLSLREELKARGTDATVFFWLATEDHDFDEVSHLLLQTRDGLEEIRARERSSARTPVGNLRTPTSLIESWKTHFPESANEAGWLDPGLTMGESFARLMAEVLRGRGVVLVDSLLPSLRAAGRTMLRRVAENLDEIEAIIDRRAAEIGRRGYPVPISKSEDRYSLLYLIDHKGERQSVYAGNAGEYIAALEASPERCSTAALIRPILQDFVFGSDVFVGGPSEVAYYSQILPLHHYLGVAAPHVAVRGHALVAPERLMQTISRYSLAAADIFSTTQQITERFEKHALGQLESKLEEVWTAMQSSYVEGVKLIMEADPALERSLARSSHRMRSEMDRVIRRGKLAVSRRDGDRFARLTRLHETLAPKGSPQDRVAGWLPWFQRYGTRLVDRLVENCAIDQSVCKVVSL